MLRASPLVSTELPYCIALRHATRWVDALRVLHSTKRLLRDLHDPLPSELTFAVPLMTNSWALVLFFAEFVRPRPLALKSDESRLLNSLLIQCSKTNSHGLMSAVFNHYASAGIVTPTQQFHFLLRSQNWAGAMELVSRAPKMMNDRGVVEGLFRAAASSSQWEVAASLFVSHRHLRQRVSRISNLNRCLCIQERWDLAMHVFAGAIASGSRSNILDVFHPLIRSLTRRGLWKEALCFALDHGAAEKLRSSAPAKEGAADTALMHVPQFTSSIIFCLSAIDYYPSWHSQTMQLLTISRSTEIRRASKLRSVSSIFREFSQITKRIDQAVVAAVPGYKRMLHGPISTFLPQIPDDAIVIIDTSFLIWCLTHGLSIESFRDEIRRTHPHLDKAALKSLVCPFRVFLESVSLVDRGSFSKGVSPKKAKKRLRDFLFLRKDFTVVSFSTEFSCGAFFLLQKMIGVSDCFNPDRHILNLALNFQFEGFRRRCSESRQESQPRHMFADLDEFLFYHVNRVAGNRDGHVDPKLLLLTFDKELAMNADRLGILTYPNYQGEHARSLKIGHL